MTDTMRILPNEALPIEVALEKLSALTIREIDVNALRRMRDPYQASVSHLPFLAWGRGVDLWRDSWPEWKKRRITSEIYQMKGIKGTLPGIDKYLSYMDAEIYDAVIPPVGVFLVDYDKGALDNWKAQFPELRRYPYSIAGERPCFAVGAGLRAVPGYVGAFFIMENPAARYYGRRATIVKNGIETEIRSFDQMGTWGSDVAIDVTTFAISSEAKPSDPFIDRCFIGHAFIANENRGRLITLSGNGTMGRGQIPSGVESVTPLSIAPERIYERHDAKYNEKYFSGEVKVSVNNTFVYSDAASQHIYDRWRLLGDEDIAITSPGLLAPFIGYNYIHLDPYTALLRIKATYHREGMWSYVGQTYLGYSHIGVMPEKVNDVGEAIFKSRSLRDQIWFTTATYRPMSLEDLSFDKPVPWNGMLPIQRI